MHSGCLFAETRTQTTTNGKQLATKWQTMNVSAGVTHVARQMLCCDRKNAILCRGPSDPHLNTIKFIIVFCALELVLIDCRSRSRW